MGVVGIANKNTINVGSRIGFRKMSVVKALCVVFTNETRRTVEEREALEDLAECQSVGYKLFDFKSFDKYTSNRAYDNKE